jgi:hypothetical protein
MISVLWIVFIAGLVLYVMIGIVFLIGMIMSDRVTEEVEVIVLPCGHWIERPRPILKANQLKLCKECDTMWKMQWDGTGTWTAERVVN